MNEERRSGKADLYVKGILFLLGILQTIMTGWCYSISNKVEDTSRRTYTLEEKVYNIKDTLNEVRSDVKKLLIRQ